MQSWSHAFGPNPRRSSHGSCSAFLRTPSMQQMPCLAAGSLVCLPLFHPSAFGSGGRNLLAGDGGTPRQGGTSPSLLPHTWLHVSDGQHRREKRLRLRGAKDRLGLVSAEANPASLAGSRSGLGGVNPAEKGGRRVSTHLDPHLSSSGPEHPNLKLWIVTLANLEVPRRASCPPFPLPLIPQGRNNIGAKHRQRQSGEALAINNTLPCSNI